MNTPLPIKYSLKNAMIICNLALLLFVFLSVSFVNLAQAGERSTQEKVIYLADFACLADDTSEYDSEDHSVGIAYDANTNFAVVLHTLVGQAKSSNHLDSPHLRPLTRAPPKAFI